MKGFMGISGKKMTSIVFLLAVLLIALALGSVTFLINDNDASLPNVGLEGNENMEEEPIEEEEEEEEPIEDEPIEGLGSVIEGKRNKKK